VEVLRGCGDVDHRPVGRLRLPALAWLGGGVRGGVRGGGRVRVGGRGGVGGRGWG